MNNRLNVFGENKLLMVLVVLLLIAVVAGVYFLLPAAKISYTSAVAAVVDSTEPVASTTSFVVTHVNKPESMRAVYFSSWASGSSQFRKHMFDLLETTEINAVVIDVKDYTGRVSFTLEDPELKKIGSAQERIPDIKNFVAELHKRGAYVIGRISAFQDSYLIKIHPEWAVKTKEGAVWQDYKGVKWLDAGARPVWDYLISIGKEAYADGFDELNFDYIRFPSDGNLEDIAYSWSVGQEKADVLKDFFIYLHAQFMNTGIPISADLFGLTTSAEGDLGIGQVLENALPYFDRVYPMVYPSHFGKGFIGYEKPAEHPYEVIKYSMGHAIDKAITASTSPEKLAPWLQAFDLGAIYTPEMVRAQIQATYDSGLKDWLLWDAGNIYDKKDLLPKNTRE